MTAPTKDEVMSYKEAADDHDHNQSSNTINSDRSTNSRRGRHSTDAPSKDELIMSLKDNDSHHGRSSSSINTSRSHRSSSAYGSSGSHGSSQHMSAYNSRSSRGSHHSANGSRHSKAYNSRSGSRGSCHHSSRNSRDHCLDDNLRGSDIIMNPQLLGLVKDVQIMCVLYILLLTFLDAPIGLVAESKVNSIENTAHGVIYIEMDRIVP